MIKQSEALSTFLELIAIDSKSNPNSQTVPSTKGQLNVRDYIEKKLRDLNLNVITGENGYIYSKIPSNCDKKTPKIGFIAHMDTAPDLSGTCINPQIIKNYDGQDIKLNDEYVLSANDFTELPNYAGKTLITTDGTTLLGCDDKGGITAILTACEYLVNHPELKHGEISIGFTPDEEIGRGADLFSVETFDADFAYTIDGGEIGELQYENFNAASFELNIKGRNVHPGMALNKMINAMTLGQQFDRSLPNQRPENTSGYEGFYLLTSFNGTVDEANLSYIIRDHSTELFESRKNIMISLVEKLDLEYPKATFSYKITDSYYNMAQKVEENPQIMELAKKAFEKVGVEPKVEPIRGGTDGSRLSFMGLPTPNIFTGGHNFHGRFEYTVLESMVKATEIIVQIALIGAENEN